MSLGAAGTRGTTIAAVVRQVVARAWGVQRPGPGCRPGAGITLAEQAHEFTRSSLGDALIALRGSAEAEVPPLCPGTPIRIETVVTQGLRLAFERKR